jgi:hypothetical protein
VRECTRKGFIEGESQRIGDPEIDPLFALPESEKGGPGIGTFEARLMADIRQALTGFGILARVLERGGRPDPDCLDTAFKGDTRAVLADGGRRITDRDLIAEVVAAEHLTAGQIL